MTLLYNQMQENSISKNTEILICKLKKTLIITNKLKKKRVFWVKSLAETWLS